jgi:hypothetical protein
MRKTTRTIARIAAAMGLGGAWLLAGCTPVPPPITCNTPSLGLGQNLTAPTADSPCNFGNPWLAVVAHTLEATGATDGGYPDTVLAGTNVKVTQGGPGILLCPGLGCTPDAGEIEVTADSHGLVEYTMSADLSAVFPGPGQSYVESRTMALESYGAGNSCPVPVELDFVCAVPIDTGSGTSTGTGDAG